MKGAGLGHRNVRVAPGAGEVPGPCGVRSASTAFCKHLDDLEREREFNLLNVHIGGWNTDDKNNVCTCSGAMEKGDAMLSELNTSDMFVEFHVFDCRAPNKTSLGFLPKCMHVKLCAHMWVGREAHRVTRWEHLSQTSCQEGETGHRVRCGFTLRRAGSLTCSVSQDANHNRECGSKNKGSSQNNLPWPSLTHEEGKDKVSAGEPACAQGIRRKPCAAELRFGSTLWFVDQFLFTTYYYSSHVDGPR